MAGSGSMKGLKTGIWAAIAALFLLSAGFLGWQYTDRRAEILSGLTDGDRVLLYPSDALEDGSLIADRALAD